MANNKALQALVNAGADAYKNMYDVRVVFPWNASDEKKEVLTVRAQNFTVPLLETKVSPIQYHGVKINVPNPEQNIERQFDVTFRMDAAYALYGNFCLWHETVGDLVSGGVANWAGAIGKVEVEAINGMYAATDVNEYTKDATYDLAETKVDGANVNPTWRFYDVWVSKVTQPEFDTGSSDALTFTVTFQFGDCDYPYYNQTGVSGTVGKDSTKASGARTLGYES